MGMTFALFLSLSGLSPLSLLLVLKMSPGIPNLVVKL